MDTNYLERVQKEKVLALRTLLSHHPRGREIGWLDCVKNWTEVQEI